MLNRRAFILLGTASALSACSSSALPTGSTTPTALSRGTIIGEINSTRKANGGHKPLSYNTSLEAVARTHADLMAARNTLSHTIGGTLRERVNVVGYHDAVGENLGAGQKTLEAVIAGWLASRGHRSTLLSDRFTEFGLAAARSSNGTVYWAFIAGGPMSAWL